MSQKKIIEGSKQQIEDLFDDEFDPRADEKKHKGI